MRQNAKTINTQW